MSNYCASCLKCLLPKVHVPPVVNQFEFHVGMGADPDDIVSASIAAKIVPQAYSVLGDGKLISVRDAIFRNNPLMHCWGTVNCAASAKIL